jgi:hypothetical protein
VPVTSIARIVLGQSRLKRLVIIETAAGIEQEFRCTTHDEINSGRVALQGIVHDAQYLLIVLISLPFVY